MFIFVKRRSLTGLAAVALMGLATPTALAQVRSQPFFQVQQAQNLRQAAFNTMVFGRPNSFLPAYAFGVSPYAAPAAAAALNAATIYSSPYAAYANPYTASLANSLYGGYDTGAGGYGGSPYSPYYESPLGGYLRGAADIIGSEGKALVAIEQAKIMHEQVRRDRIDNRRRLLDEYLYERANTPTPEDDREKAMKELVRRSLNDPPVGDIVSAQALNTLLADIQKKNPKDLSGGSIPLSDDALRHINVKPPSGDGNPGLLKNEGRLAWPLVLRGSDYKEERDALNDLTPVAYDQAVSGKVDPATLTSMTNAVNRLRQKLSDNVNKDDMTPTQYGEARRFLNDFDSALALLRQPNPGQYFSQKAPKGKTIGDLVQHLSSNGLVFAPAVPGDESAYLAVHRALVGYDTSGNAQVAAEKPAEKEKEK